jgi:hypothetical protein
MHASVALTRSAPAASLELIAGPSGMGTKAMYKMPTTMAPPKVVKNAVAILSFIVAPQQRCRHAGLRRFCAFLQATRKSPVGARLFTRRGHDWTDPYPAIAGAAAGLKERPIRWAIAVVQKERTESAKIIPTIILLRNLVR